VGEPAFWMGYNRSGANSFQDYFRQLTEWEPKRAASYGIRHFAFMGINAKEAEDVGFARDVIALLPELLDRHNVLGIGEPGTLLCILVENKVGQLKRIVDAITEEKISFGSVLVARYWEKDKRAVFPYLLTNNVIRIKKKLQDMGFTLLDPMQWYMDQLPKAE
jgi:hypothetical protein